MSSFNSGLVFNNLRENRDNYWVEYIPARMGQYFASISLNYIELCKPEKIAVDMEKECSDWINRYSVPVMVTAFDSADNVVQLKPYRNQSHLIGIPKNDGVTFHWESLDNESFPHGTYNESDLKQIYNDLNYTTQFERTNIAIRKARQFKRIYLCLAAFWLLPPILVFIIGIASPAWGILIGLFSI